MHNGNVSPPPEKIMKRSDSSRANSERFHAPIRHYHRINTEQEMSWDEWVHGRRSNDRFSPKNIKKWLKIGAGLLCLLTLSAVIAGLFIELS